MDPVYAELTAGLSSPAHEVSSETELSMLVLRQDVGILMRSSGEHTSSLYLSYVLTTVRRITELLQPPQRVGAMARHCRRWRRVR